MKVLVCGAKGFVGRHIAAALRAQRHEVIHGVSPRTSGVQDAHLPMNFASDLDPEVWVVRLRGVDAVVNAVGVLRDQRRSPMQRIHAEVPAALFTACARAGVRRVVQVSALGIEGNGTAYARSKLEAETQLAGLRASGRLDAVVLRPSVVYGRGGASAALFDALARLPFLALPAEVIRCRIQPVLVEDLAVVVSRLVSADSLVPDRLDCVGPRAKGLAEFIATLRQQQGRGPAKMLEIPAWMTRWSVALGDALPFTPWGTEALALLASDNTADGSDFQHWLGRPARDPGGFS